MGERGREQNIGKLFKSGEEEGVGEKEEIGREGKISEIGRKRVSGETEWGG